MWFCIFLLWVKNIQFHTSFLNLPWKCMGHSSFTIGLDQPTKPIPIPFHVLILTDDMLNGSKALALLLLEPLVLCVAKIHTSILMLSSCNYFLASFPSYKEFHKFRCLNEICNKQHTPIKVRKVSFLGTIHLKVFLCLKGLIPDFWIRIVVWCWSCLMLGFYQMVWFTQPRNLGNFCTTQNMSSKHGFEPAHCQE